MTSKKAAKRDNTSTPSPNPEHLEQAVNLLSVSFFPFTEFQLCRYLKDTLNYTDMENNFIVRYLIKSGTLQESETVTFHYRYNSRYILAPGERADRLLTMRDSLSEKEKDRLAAASAQQSQPLIWEGHREDHTEEFYTEMAKVLLKEGYVSHLSEYNGYCGTPDLVIFIRFIISDKNLFPLYRGTIDRIPHNVFLNLTGYAMDDCNKGDWKVDYDTVREIVEKSPFLTDSNKSILYQLLSFPTRVLRGNMDDLGFKEEDADTTQGFIALAVKSLLDKDYKSAEKMIRLAFKCCGRKSPLFGVPLFDLLYISCLKMSASRMAFKTLDSIYNKDVVPADASFKAVGMLLESFYKDTSGKGVASVERNIMNMTLLNSYVSYAILSKMNLVADKNIIEIGEKLAKDKNYALLLNPDIVAYTYKANWEKAYDNLVSKLGYSTAGSAVAGTSGQAQSKVVYYISDDGRYIQPVLKKSKDGVNWSKGRNIALLTFHSGIPEMSDLDRQIASKIKATSGWGGTSYSLGGDSVIKLLVGHKDVYRDDTVGAKVEIVSEDPYITVVKKKSDLVFESNVDEKYFPGEFIVQRQTDTYYKVITCSKRQKEIITSLKDISFPKEATDQVKQLISFISRDIVVHSDLIKNETSCRKIDCNSRITATMLPINDGLKIDLYVKPFDDVPPYFRPGKGAVTVISNIDGEAVQTERNLKAELKNKSVVTDIVGQIFDDDCSEAETFECCDTESCLNIVEAFQQMGDNIRVEWPQGCKFSIKKSCDVSSMNIKVKSNANWFEVSGSLDVSEDMVIQMGQLLEMLRNSSGRFIKIGEDEFIALSEKLRQHLDNIAATAQNLKEKKFNLPKLAIQTIADIEEAGAKVRQDNAARQLLSSIRDSSDKHFPVPAGLTAELRPYQEEGYQWMCRLSTWGAGACLADDMGLGKTVQTIAVLLQRANEGSSLVVAPASVVANWEKEIVRFAPSLHVAAINSVDTETRKKFISEASSFDVVLVSYGLLLSEKEAFASREWNTMVLDEAHIIKNKEAKTSSACMEIKAAFRIILTGTPIQNHLGELWSLFQFINPGYLGSYNHFHDTFLIPIQEDGDKQVQARLKRMVLPFLLRRTKSDVLDELPKKTEQMVYVTLSSREQAIYENLRRKAQIDLEEHQSNLVQTLAHITKLRMAACDVSLAHPGLEGIESSKITELTSLVQDILAGNHKVLIFSQFTSFLSIVRNHFDSTGLNYEYLDGSTPLVRRQEIVKNFQTGETPIFLISLKAGGLGLNLTAADYIIHTDPWWNPSVEDQASDRAYRIGQTRPVTVYRMVAKGTIEEKILSLHKDKRSLADSLLEGADMSSKLTREELVQLLSDTQPQD